MTSTNTVSLRDLLCEELQEVGYYGVSLQRQLEPPIYVHRRLGVLERARERDPDVGALRLARPVHDAPHDRDPQRFDAGVARSPPRHLLPEVGLDLLGHLLKEGGGGATAAGARRHLGREAAQAERLEDLLRDLHLLGAVAAGPGR